MYWISCSFIPSDAGGNILPQMSQCRVAGTSALYFLLY